VLAKPGSVTPHTKFQKATCLRADAKTPRALGAPLTPFLNGYKPGADSTSRTAPTSPAPVEACRAGGDVMPGDNIEMEVELMMPIAMDKESVSHPRGRPHVGAGVVTQVIA